MQNRPQEQRILDATEIALLKKAEENDAEANFKIGEDFYFGNALVGFKQDYNQACKFFLRAALASNVTPEKREDALVYVLSILAFRQDFAAASNFAYANGVPFGDFEQIENKTKYSAILKRMEIMAGLSAIEKKYRLQTEQNVFPDTLVNQCGNFIASDAACTAIRKAILQDSDNKILPQSLGDAFRHRLFVGTQELVSLRMATKLQPNETESRSQTGNKKCSIQ